MKRRTFISLMSVMAAAGVLSLSGCSSSNNTAASTAGTAASSAASAGGDLLAAIQNRGTLIVALEGAWQPWSFHDADDTLEETIQLLTAGRIDATLNADVSFYDYLNVHPDADFKLVAFTEEASHVAIPLRKGDETATLLEAINSAIEELRTDGTLSELSEKYFGQDISSEN